MTPDAFQQQEKPVHIHADDAQPIVFHPANDDLFVRTGQEVIASCQLGIGLELWLKEVDTVIEDVRAWCQANPAVQSCHVAVFRGRVNLFFIPVSASYDCQLGLELSDLTARLYQQYNIGMIEVHQLPDRELSRFMPLSASRKIYVQQAAAH